MVIAIQVCIIATYEPLYMYIHELPFLLRAEPFQAMVYDDWPTTNIEAPVKDRQLQLSFTVSGSKVVAMLTVMAIPKLVAYAGKFVENLEAQREGASRESSAFRSAQIGRAHV